MNLNVKEEHMVAKKDKTMPDGKWKFDEGVTAVFDDMLARSIPQYEVMRRTCTDLAARFVRQSTDVVDLGCSRGEAVAPLVDRFGAGNRFWLIDVSKPMLEATRRRFKGYLADAHGDKMRGVVKVLNLDLRTDYPPVESSVTLCVLTLQFTPIEHRQRIMQNVYDHTAKDGALIFVEKVLASNAKVGGIMVDTYHAMKKAHGYSDEVIERKRLALEGVLVPVTARWNEELLASAGFTRHECFWRWMNFAGWIALKT